MCDQDNIVFFDRECPCIFSRSSKEAKEILRLVQLLQGRRVDMVRHNGTYQMDVEVGLPATFQRQV